MNQAGKMYGVDRKSSSSDEDLLDDSEELEAQKKKHFLDYDYGDSPQHTSKINVLHAKASNEYPISVSSSSNNNNNNRPTTAPTNQLDCKKKLINDRPSTSKMAMMDQLNSNTLALTNNNNNSNNVETVYSIFSMLGSYNSADITSKFLEFSKNREMCATLRQSGCISLLVQIIHSEPDDGVRQKQCLQTLHNIIHCNADDKAGRRESRVIKLIEQLFDYCDALRLILRNELSDNVDRHPIQAIGTLMKISFDEEHRHAMCQLGALQTISTLIQLDHAVHGSTSSDSSCITMRRYAGMCLTNLTFGDGNNKALLCSNKNFMKALVDQINCNSDELVQVTASVIRNLSWRADANMKEALNEIKTVKILALASMKCTQENTLKAILSALWNLSNHCAKNKAEICDIEGAIEFLIDMLSYDAPSKTMAVIENAGGILRNISTHMTLHERYRVILRQKNCFTILLQQLKSPSLTVVSNACGTLGNLSAHNVEDQKFLRDNGAIPMLRSLIYSKHKMISTGSTVALRHLLACKSNMTHGENLDSVAKMMDLKELPTLNVRKQRALEQELNLTAENYKLDETSPSTKDDKIRDFETVSKVNKNKSNNNNSNNDRSSEMRVQEIEDEEAPTNFSKFDDDQDETGEKCEYQESDQITDYSIRYGENQDCDSDDGEETRKRRNILSADDTTKCYNEEGTPATISKAGSMSDLRKEKLLSKEPVKTVEVEKKVKGKFSAGASGLQSPEKTVNYCVEGTPGNFSRNDSLSDLEEASRTPPIISTSSKSIPNKSSIASKIPPPLTIKKESVGEKESVAATPKSVTFVNLAEETPLMFSRTSSMGSLSSAEPTCIDDKSSVVSDFSRLASGVMSPSDLPDSPTQSVPQSPSSRQPKPAPRNIPVIKTPLPATREIIGAEAADDSTNMFNVENTPAVFSSRTSLSNLSFDDEPKISTDTISKDFHLMKHPSEDEDSKMAKKMMATESFAQDITAEHSDVESSDDNILFESCINMGINRVVKQKETANGSSSMRPENSGTSSAETIPKISPQMMKENPIDMMRSTPLLPPYLPVVDEMNRFIVEDSPCNFSVMSGLSAITIESNMHAVNQAIKPTAKVDPTIRNETDEGAGSSQKPLKKLLPDYEDSLSSLSVESEDDANLLNQAIAAGVQKPKKQDVSNPINIPMKPKTSTDIANNSISSVDSCDKDDATNSILEQCIRSGINKGVKKDSAKHRPLMTSSPKKSLLPTPSTSNKKVEKSQALQDEELLKECIATGMMKTSKPDNVLLENFSKLSIADPKNGETTSVIATMDVQCVITGVELSTEKKKMYNNVMQQDQDESIGSENERSLPVIWMMPNGSSSMTYELSASLNSIDDNILERSNEYPANKLSMLAACVDLEDESIMDVSNEFLIENEKTSEAKIEDKHKNPDLMLKSVDRLTQELVSTAEYLRKNVLTNDDISEQKMSSSISNNTWNDEVSFPSISMTAPMIGSTNDEATFATDQINPLPEEKIDGNNQLDDKTPTNEHYVFNTIKNEAHSESPSPKLDFKVGGEIQSLNGNKINFLSYGPASIDTLSSTMSNSTIVQVEAKRIANDLMNNQMMDSTTSLDLENIRPPSSMDAISLCSYQDLSVVQSPHKVQSNNNGNNKKSLLTGLVAKRALGHQMFGGSVESINSINNIDSIRPPSLMDELLDSMISVDSITSEIVDPTFAISSYETALSDMEDSLTLRSCQDLSKDETLTPMSSDFSSVESTPKKKRNIRATTPKQKRQSEKDRFKTYTIAVDMLLKEQEMQNSLTESSRRSSLNARQRRQEDRQRFETQVITPETSLSVSRRKDDPDRYRTFNIEDEDCSIRDMTANFEFIRTELIEVKTNNIFDATGLRDKLNIIRFNGSTSSNSPAQMSNKNSDESLEDEHQSSETESQRDLKNVLHIEEVINVEEVIASPASEIVKTKGNKTSYISPYRMTAKITPTKNKSVRVTKSPIIAKVITTTKNSCLEYKSNNILSPKLNISNSKMNGNKSRFGVIPKASMKSNNVVASSQNNLKPEKIEEEIPQVAPIIRQGTFVKDEPTNEQIPVVDVEPANTPIKNVQQQSKLKPPTRLSSASKTPSIESKNSSPKRTSNLPTSLTQLKYRSNSNASMKIKEISNPVARSNTGITLNNPKKNVSSKIAGIWKNNDKRTISSSSTQLNGGSKLSTPTGNVNRKIVNSPTKDTTRIKRSSTCEQIGKQKINNFNGFQKF
ncbi:hypothetical protein ACKWTF_004457 [Chironomus riparius]